MYETIGRSLGTDYFRIADQLTPEELDYLRRTRAFVDDEVLPVINDYWGRAEFPRPLIEKMAGSGHCRRRHQGYGCPPMSPIASGLVHMELNRGDGSLGHVPRRSGRSRDAVHRDARFGGAEAALAAGHGAAGEPRRLRAHRADARVGLGRARDDRSPRRRHVDDQRREEVDRQRHDRRRRRGVGPRRGRRAGQGLPGREGHRWLRRAKDRGQGVAACGLAGRDHAHRRAGSGGEPAAGSEQLQGHRPGARRYPQRGRLGRARARHRGLRDRRALLRGSGPSSASRWSASRSCRTSSSRCSPRSARCSCTACGSAG